MLTVPYIPSKQYIGARYLPIIVGDWDITKKYEPLMVVYYNGASYTSKTYIPAGIDISNTTYWALSADYNAQVAAYRAEVLSFKDDIDDFKAMIKEGFVTPEMYGAVGDGVVDDSQALQDALSSGSNVLIPNKRYNIKENTLYITQDNNSIIYGAGSTIIYEGTDYAVDITRVNQKNITLGTIIALSGSCIDLHSDGWTSENNDRVQYVNLTFDVLEALNNCIHAAATGNPSWVNEIRVNKGRFQSGTNGILLEHTVSTGEINGWRFDNITFEGVTNGLVLSSSNGDINSISLTNVRVLEQPTAIVKTTGGAYDIFFSTSDQMSELAFDLSTGTRQMVIEGPLFATTPGGGNPVSFYTRVGRNNVKLYNIPKTLTVTYNSGTVNTEYSRVCIVDQMCYVTAVVNGVTLGANEELLTLPVAPTNNTYITDLDGRKWRMLSNGKLVTDTALNNTAVFLQFSFPIYVNYS